MTALLDWGHYFPLLTYFYELLMNLLLLEICIQVCCCFEQLLVVPIFKVLDVFFFFFFLNLLLLFCCLTSSPVSCLRWNQTCVSASHPGCLLDSSASAGICSRVPMSSSDSKRNMLCPTTILSSSEHVTREKTTERSDRVIWRRFTWLIGKGHNWLSQKSRHLKRVNMSKILS